MFACQTQRSDRLNERVGDSRAFLVSLHLQLQRTSWELSYAI